MQCYPAIVMRARVDIDFGEDIDGLVDAFARSIERGCSAWATHYLVRRKLGDSVLTAVETTEAYGARPPYDGAFHPGALKWVEKDVTIEVVGSILRIEGGWAQDAMFNAGFYARGASSEAAHLWDETAGHIRRRLWDYRVEVT